LIDEPTIKERIEADLFNLASIIWRCRARINLIQFPENGKDEDCRGSGIPEAQTVQISPFRFCGMALLAYETELLIKLIRSVISWSSQEYFYLKQSLIIMTRIVCLSIYRLAMGDTDCSRVPVLLRSRWN